MTKEPQKKKQIMRYTDKELALFKGVFTENDDLLKSIRKVFYQMPLNAVDQAFIQTNFKNPELVSAVRKMFLPEIIADVPLGQEVDLFMTVHLKELLVSEASVHLKSIQIWKDYIAQQLAVLENLGLSKIDEKIHFTELSDIRDKTDREMYADMMARNTIVNHVESGLMQLLILAGQKDETLEQTQERLKKNSTK
jgi:hypothetical protein